jgi:hypothetical protein
MNRPEQEAQIAIVAWIKAVSPSTMCFHVPNAAKRSPAERRALVAMGLLAGVPDLCLIAEPPGPSLAFVEVKAAGGKLSPEQQSFRAWAEAAGIPYAVVQNIDETRVAFREWLVPTRESAT